MIDQKELEAYQQHRKEIARIRARAWNRDHKALVKKNHRVYYEQNREAIKLYMKEYRVKNLEARNAYQRSYYEKYPWYPSWQGARQRCVNPKNCSYRHYGAKGVKFKLSKRDMAFMWQRDHADRLSQPSLDRIDPKGDYTSANCRFIELLENVRRRVAGDWEEKRRVADENWEKVKAKMVN